MDTWLETRKSNSSKLEIFQILSSPPFDYRNCCQRFHFVLPPPPPLIASRINVNESNATKVEFVHPCSRVMSTIGRRGGRVAAGCRQPPCRFAASLFAPNRWFVHLAGQHFGPLRTVEADRERERERGTGRARWWCDDAIAPYAAPSRGLGVYAPTN